ncbi:hypothetical protein D3C73_881170 [compost metagenome]
MGSHRVSDLNVHELVKLSEFISYLVKEMNYHGLVMDEVVMMTLVECFLEDFGRRKLG